MATNIWYGGAVPVAEVKTVTLNGGDAQWATGDTATITINGKDLTLTVGGTSTVAQIAADIVDMINGAAVNGTETRNILGTQVGEFVQLTATSSSNVVTITGKSDGQPIGTITVSEVTAGTGTLSTASVTTGTGPYSVNNADNWSDGIPNGDDIVFDHRATCSCLYDLETLVAVTSNTITVSKGFKFQIGLPEINTNDQTYTYDEFRETYFQVDGGNVTIDASGAQLVKIDTSDVTSAIIVNGSGTTSERNTPAVLVKANETASTLTVNGGHVGLCWESKTTGRVENITVSGGATLEIGDTVTIDTSITQVSGETKNFSATPTVAVYGGTYEQKEGGCSTSLTASGGIVYVSSDDTFASVVVEGGGIIDCTRDSRSRTFTAAAIYKGGSIIDPAGTISWHATNGLDVYCKPTEITLDIPPQKTMVIKAIS